MSSLLISPSFILFVVVVSMAAPVVSELNADSVIGDGGAAAAAVVVCALTVGASSVDDAFLLRSMSMSLSADDDVDSLPTIFDDDEDDVIIAV